MRSETDELNLTHLWLMTYVGLVHVMDELVSVWTVRCKRRPTKLTSTPAWPNAVNWYYSKNSCIHRWNLHCCVYDTAVK